ncbi:MAG: DedA family protein [Thermoplasmata archaeon]|nr:DedA family protein [Thermoplasmata archaeon]
MSLVEWGTQIIIDVIQTLGYPGVIFLMTLESACMPVPSEIVMPFAGFLAYSNGTFSIIGLTIAGTIGNLIGSIAAYWVGLKAGRPFVLKYGKYVLLRKKHLDIADSWFCKYGELTTFFSRMLPVVRTFISLPAGIARMNFKKFVIYTTAGSIPWNFALAYAGYELGAHWDDLTGIFAYLDIIVIIAVIALIVYLIRDYRIDMKCDATKK